MDHIVLRTNPDHYDAYTLSADFIGYHADTGWTIKGEIHNDYFEWVNEFEASHPEYGFVRGDFEHEVIASSIDAFNDFVSHYPPEAWSYGDI